jgi:hypothetical protein
MPWQHASRSWRSGASLFKIVMANLFLFLPP